MEPVRTEERPRAIPAPGVTISSLIEKVAAYGPEGTEEMIADAYGVAYAAHRGQTRKSGEPFVYHPLAAADILAARRPGGHRHHQSGARGALRGRGSRDR